MLTTNQLVGFGSIVQAPVEPVAITLTETLQSNTNATSYTISSADLGAYTPDRKIIVEAGGHGSTASARSVSSITVDAQAAAVIQDGGATSAVVNASVGNRAILAAWIIDAGVGTALESVETGDVVVTFNAGMLDGNVVVKVMTGAPSVTANDVVVDSNDDPLIGLIDVPANGVASAVHHEYVGTVCTWTNVIELGEAVGEGIISSAAEQYSTLQTNLSVEADVTGGGSAKLVCYSYGP